MTQRDYKLHNGKKGAAIGVRVTPNAAKNKIVGALPDGTLKIELKTAADNGQSNQALVEFLSEILGIPKERIEVVAGDLGRDKLVSVLDMDSETLHQKIVESIE